MRREVTCDSRNNIENQLDLVQFTTVVSKVQLVYGSLRAISFRVSEVFSKGFNFLVRISFCELIFVCGNHESQFADFQLQHKTLTLRSPSHTRKQQIYSPINRKCSFE